MQRPLHKNQPPIIEEPFSYSTADPFVPLLIAGILLTLEGALGVSQWLASTWDWLPGGAMPKLILFAICGVLIFTGMTRFTTTFHPREKQIIRTLKVFFVLPLWTRKWRFADIRYVDFHHPQSGMLPEGQFHDMVFYCRYRYTYIGRESFHFAEPYEIHLMMQDRTRFLVMRGFGRDATLAHAEKMAQVTEKRLG